MEDNGRGYNEVILSVEVKNLLGMMIDRIMLISAILPLAAFTFIKSITFYHFLFGKCPISSQI